MRLVSKLNSFSFALILLIATFAFFILLLFLSETSLYGGDSYSHYLISKYAFKHPEHFLDHWGKPLFTLLSAPFAVFGFHGMMFFNILVCALSSFLALLVCKKLQYQNLSMVVVFTFFAPIYILLMFSGLTEALFALVLIASVYFFIDKKYLVAAIIISFVPFVRSEGLMFLAWFFVLLFIKKQYKSLPFLLFGLAFYSLLGWFILGDFFWLVTNNPYKSSGSIYGHGTLMFYISSVPFTFGVGAFCLAIIGLLVLLFSPFQKRELLKNELFFNELFVVSFSAVGYFLFHAIVWWKGWLSVLGDHRFMAAIVPLIAIMALKGVNSFIWIVKLKALRIVALCFVSGIVIYFGIMVHSLPVKYIGENKVVNQAITWMIDHKYDEYKTIIFYNPIVPILLNKDPFQNPDFHTFVPDSDIPDKGVNPNTIVIWDGHFSALEGQLPYARMQNNANYQLLKEFVPDPPFKFLDTIDYKVGIFIRK